MATCTSCSCSPCTCLESEGLVPTCDPAMFPPETQLIKYPTAVCSSAAEEAAAAAAAAEEPCIPCLGCVKTSFVTPAISGQQSQFLSTGASTFILPGSWVYFSALGYLKVLAVSGDTVTYELPPQPYGVAATTQILADACFALLAPLENFPLDFDVRAALDDVCNNDDDCPCTIPGELIEKIYVCTEAGLRLLPPPDPEATENPVITGDGAGNWIVKDVSEIVDAPSEQVILPGGQLVRSESFQDRGHATGTLIGAAAGGTLGSDPLEFATAVTAAGGNPDQVCALYVGVRQTGISAAGQDEGTMFFDIGPSRIIETSYDGSYNVVGAEVYVWIPYSAAPVFTWGWTPFPGLVVGSNPRNNSPASNWDAQRYWVHLLGWQTKGSGACPTP